LPGREGDHSYARGIDQLVAKTVAPDWALDGRGTASSGKRGRERMFPPSHHRFSLVSL